MLENFVHGDKATKDIAQPTGMIRGGQEPSFLQMANFVTNTLTGVLTKDQQYSMSNHSSDPKFIQPPMTDVQRAQVTTKVLNALLNPRQLQEFAQTGQISANTLDEKQAQSFADMSAGYALGRVLNLNQFTDHINGKPIVTSLPQMEALRAGGLVRIPQLDRSPAVYSTIKTPLSKYMLNMGRYMSEPITNLLKTDSNKLMGGGSKLIYFKSHLDNLGF